MRFNTFSPNKLARYVASYEQFSKVKQIKVMLKLNALLIIIRSS